ncbi:SAM-dependent chlorinase/fluorinase [Solidesulfovibrio sp.]|uniref:SAM hydrolase/SAM-dependent halogenase family protein n=1 Tax=Solidesulfovibrio sp. TaxID=2910990 RepID=UPI0026383519|nr:SAM-dependent chlorinase/fluorinase [Solidesulfovibrio sp.]
MPIPPFPPLSTPPSTPTAPLIALLTDFGQADPYVAQMRAVLMAAAPGVPLLDVSHEVRPGDVWQAGFFLAATLPWLPPGSVACAVVDPGVGTDRRVLLVETASRLVLAPDNGLLTLTFGRSEGCRILDATPRLVPASATFHGRDVFAPLAARLAMGEEPRDVATVLGDAEPVLLGGLEPVRGEGTVAARVLSVDRFGNCILNLDIGRFGRVPRGVALAAPVAVRLSPARTYAGIRSGEVGLLAGSQGYLELAVDSGSAAARLGLGVRDAVTLAWPQGETEIDFS